MPSLWSDSQDSFDTCLSVKTRFLTLLLSSPHPHFLSFIPSWHLLASLSIPVFSSPSFLTLPMPFLPLSPPPSLFFFICPSFLTLLNSHILSLNLSCACRPPYLPMASAVLHWFAHIHTYIHTLGLNLSWLSTQLESSMMGRGSEESCFYLSIFSPFLYT